MHRHNGREEQYCCTGRRGLRPGGLAEYGAANYRVAEERFAEAYALYTAAGDTNKALTARNAIFQANRTYTEYQFDRSAAEAALRERVPGITDAAIAEWLDTRAQKLVSENETLYFYDVAGNYLYAHPPDEMQKQTVSGVDFDYIGRYAWAEDRPEHGPYVNPVRYAGGRAARDPARGAPPLDGYLKDLAPAPGRDGRAEERHRHEPLVPPRLHRRRPVHHRSHRLRLL
ncbi:hypothetical protein [Methanoculleus chikugoensis]|uniref:hypothetical protein n=1 Tax=Methanoculleus chikugoensis TaxID=118126 RepID=UPI000B224140|nr:hypothetical protein [Methanoculleus chikugoensis]